MSKIVFNIKKHSVDCNMATVGEFDKYECVIYSREGINIPHFHLENLQDEKFIAIKILEPEYFIHGKWSSKLNSKDKKDLIKFLNEKPDMDRVNYKDETYYILKNNYEFICYLWQKETKNAIEYKNKEIPDYKLLN